MKALACWFLLGFVLYGQPKRPVEDFKTAAGAVQITPIRHASLLIRAGGQTIYVDPSQGDYTGLPPADLILITDIHPDHMDAQRIAQLRQPSTAIIAPAAVVKNIPGAALIRIGETKEFGKWKIEAIAAYNIPSQPGAQVFHEKGRGVGYVLSYGEKRFYFSGDTENIPEMRALKNIDVAFVCMNLPYTMPPEEAAEAVRAFKPAIVYPYHYHGSDLKVFEKALAGSGVEVRIRDWYY
jgi:L-ascorbate metabolism protein UlaG (beta-lactamase superfamily)